MRMNQETKLVFALEHIAHLEDLIKDNNSNVNEVINSQEFLRLDSIKLPNNSFALAGINCFNVLNILLS